MKRLEKMLDANDYKKSFTVDNLWPVVFPATGLEYSFDFATCDVVERPHLDGYQSPKAEYYLCRGEFYRNQCPTPEHAKAQAADYIQQLIDALIEVQEQYDYCFGWQLSKAISIIQAANYSKGGEYNKLVSKTVYGLGRGQFIDQIEDQEPFNRVLEALK